MIAQLYYYHAYLPVEQPLGCFADCQLLPAVHTPTLICSVGKAPMPTRVVYAFTTPYTSPTCCGGTPSPVHTPPTVQFDEVTKGYVPARKTQQHSPLSALGRNKDWFFFISSKVFTSKFGWNSNQRGRQILFIMCNSSFTTFTEDCTQGRNSKASQCYFH